MKVYLDSADLVEIERYCAEGVISGVTTNPTLIRRAGHKDYLGFAKTLLCITDLPVSLEVFADDLPGMDHQARVLADLGDQVFVKIPVTNTLGEDTGILVNKLLHGGVSVNVTAVFTATQISRLAQVIPHHTPAIVSIFAGRIADTGCDPSPIVYAARRMLGYATDVLWASPRAVQDYYVAAKAHANVITMTGPMIDKLGLEGKDLTEFSLETVAMFHNDALAAGYAI